MIETNIIQTTINEGIAGKPTIFFLKGLPASGKSTWARSILPNALKTEIVVTANLREWRTIFEQRCASGAHEQMRELMHPLLAEIKSKIPVVFDDLYPEII